jgi:hypothetical protein
VSKHQPHQEQLVFVAPPPKPMSCAELLAALALVPAEEDLSDWLVSMNASRCRPGLTLAEAKQLREAFLERRAELRRQERAEEKARGAA